MDKPASAHNGHTFLFVFAGSELGGAERQGMLLARHLKRHHAAEVRVLGLAADREGAVAELCRREGIPWQAEPYAWPSTGRQHLAALLAFRRRLKGIGADLILSYTWLPNVMCALTWRFAGARGFVWNQRDEGHELNRSLLHRGAVRLTRDFVANSPAGADFLVRTYGLQPGRVRLIGNGLELAKPISSAAAWRQQLRLAPEQPMACMIGSLHPYKDHRTLLQAWSRICAQRPGPSPVLCLAGRFAGEADALRQLAAELGIAEQVRFLGHVDDVAGLLAAADLYLHSSRSEGCPNAVLEAMASGVAVVASDIPGTRALLGDVAAGCLVPAGDAGTLAERVLVLLDQPDTRRELGTRLQETSERRFAVGAMVQAYRQLFDEILGSSGSSRTPVVEQS